MKEKEFHEVANMLPMMDENSLQELSGDIAKNGLMEPIWLHSNGSILDGRNRYVACMLAKVEPTYRTYEGDDSELYTFVYSLNVNRRQLDDMQKATMVLQFAPKLEEEARAKMVQGGYETNANQHTAKAQGVSNLTHPANDNPAPKTRDRLAEMANTSTHDIRVAMKAKREAPDVFEAMQEGRFESRSAAESIMKVPEPVRESVLSKSGAVSNMDVKQAQREYMQERQAELKAKPLPVADGKYKTIVIDPPWPMQKIDRASAETQFGFDYPVMELEDIKEFTQVSEMADDECHLFLWTTHKFLPDSFEILEAWGFKYIFAMVWHKNGGFQPFNLPQYNCEFVLYGRKGSAKFESTKAFNTSFFADRTGHSVKPESFYELVKRVCPAPRIEIFNRGKRDGFDGWGDES